MSQKAEARKAEPHEADPFAAPTTTQTKQTSFDDFDKDDLPF